MAFLRKQITGRTKNVEFRQGVDVSWVGNESHRESTASFAVGIQAVFYGFDVARTLKGMRSELLLGNIGVEIPTYVRSDNSDDAYHVDSANTVTNEKRPNRLLESNREEL